MTILSDRLNVTENFILQSFQISESLQVLKSIKMALYHNINLFISLILGLTTVVCMAHPILESFLITLKTETGKHKLV